MAGIVYSKLIDALKGIGVDVSQQQASNVKKLSPKNKSTATKVGLLASERDRGGNFATVLDIFKDEAKYIDSMNDAEQMAFLNNILDYNEFGGKSIGVRTGIEATEEMKKFKNTQSELKKALEDLQSTTEKNKNQALKDLDDFMETGGQPLKKKDDKFLGGSMHEEGQLRTGIRQFLQSEYKNGRLKLNDLDKERIMQYSPMIEHDPILVFKKIYGDEAYKKAGTFPGAFEIGENFKHYEKIFRENMGEDLLKVKNKEYVGDGKLILTEQEEVFKPTPDDDDMPFAKGGRASFVGGKSVMGVTEIIKMLTKKMSPMGAMKELNKIIGKKGQYSGLTKADIDKIVKETNDFIFQRDPDNLFVEGSLGKTVDKVDEARAKDQKMAFEDSIKEMEGLGATQTAERFKLKQKYPGITDDLVDKILIDDNPQRKAELIATLDEAFRMMEKGKGEDEIIEIFKNTSRTKNAKGGRAGFYMGGQSTIQPDLSDIGHGSDSLMARNRLVAPGSQATTSTGLNYLLGEDNDNTRIPFAGGGADMGTVADSQGNVNESLGNNVQAPDDKSTFDQTVSHFNSTLNARNKPTALDKTITAIDMGNTLNKGYNFLSGGGLKSIFAVNPYALGAMTLAKIAQKKKQRKDAYDEETNFAEGGIADLRPGYAGGTLVDKGRRGFLKLLGATAGGVAALKLGLGKMLGKESGAISKKVIDEVIIDGSTGAPAWLQPLVNKALKEGTDITKKNAVVDGQVVKSLDTPTGKVDVYYNVRTGEVDIDYIGGNTALGESVNMRYTPGIADEGTKGKPADEFEASEAIPEGRAVGPDDFEIEVGENTVENVKGLYSDTTELAELGGQKPLMKDIVETVKKKQKLKYMEEQPGEFLEELYGPPRDPD